MLPLLRLHPDLSCKDGGALPTSTIAMNISIQILLIVYWQEIKIIGICKGIMPPSGKNETWNDSEFSHPVFK